MLAEGALAFFGRPTFTDVWADFKDVGALGTVRVGQCNF